MPLAPHPVDYPFILANGLVLGSAAEFTQGQVARARLAAAPWDVVYYSDDSRRWVRIGEYSHQDHAAEYACRLRATAVQHGWLSPTRCVWPHCTAPPTCPGGYCPTHLPKEAVRGA